MGKERYSIVYSSSTGNTKKLADTIYATVALYQLAVCNYTSRLVAVFRKVRVACAFVERPHIARLKYRTVASPKCGFHI